jgi:hypothetical protein
MSWDLNTSVLGTDESHVGDQVQNTVAETNQTKQNESLGLGELTLFKKM